MSSVSSNESSASPDPPFPLSKTFKPDWGNEFHATKEDCKLNGKVKEAGELSYTITLDKPIPKKNAGEEKTLREVTLAPFICNVMNQKNRRFKKGEEVTVVVLAKKPYEGRYLLSRSEGEASDIVEPLYTVEVETNLAKGESSKSQEKKPKPRKGPSKVQTEWKEDKAKSQTQAKEKEKEVKKGESSKSQEKKSKATDKKKS